MSFNDMKVAQLKEVAEYFAVDLEGLKNKSEILAAIQEDGITYEMYNKFVNAEKAEPEVKAKRFKKAGSEEETVLVRMERQNPRYEVNGYLFTREHPFVAMNQVDAEFIFSSQIGFRMATPKEVQEYYN